MQEENVTSKRIRAAGHAASLTLRLVLLGSFAMTTPLFSQSGASMDHSESTQAPPELVQVVRQATQKYTNVNAAISAGYQPVLGCVSGLRSWRHGGALPEPKSIERRGRCHAAPGPDL